MLHNARRRFQSFNSLACAAVSKNKRITRHSREEFMAQLNINGSIRDVEVEPDTPLLWAIREQVGLTGTKYGCGIAQCGACTVHIDGEAVRSCIVTVGSLRPEQKIATIEGLEQNGALH